MDEVNKTNLQLDLPQDTDPTISVSLRKLVSAPFFLLVFTNGHWLLTPLEYSWIR